MGLGKSPTLRRSWPGPSSRRWFPKHQPQRRWYPNSSTDSTGRVDGGCHTRRRPEATHSLNERNGCRARSRGGSVSLDTSGARGHASRLRGHGKMGPLVPLVDDDIDSKPGAEQQHPHRVMSILSTRIGATDEGTGPRPVRGQHRCRHADHLRIPHGVGGVGPLDGLGELRSVGGGGSPLSMRAATPFAALGMYVIGMHLLRPLGLHLPSRRRLEGGVGANAAPGDPRPVATAAPLCICAFGQCERESTCDSSKRRWIN